MSRSRVSVIASVLAVLSLLLALGGPAAPAGAQVVNDFVSDLRQHDVTYEEGAFGLPAQLDQLDAAAAGLQQSNAFLKVVVLGKPVTDYDTPRAFAAALLTRLGGRGRVLVFDTTNTGIASNAGDSADAIDRAEEAAATDASASDRWADGVKAAGDQLGITSGSGSGGGSGSGSGSGSSSSGGGAVILVVILLAVLVVGGFIVVRMMKKSKGGGGSTVSLGEAEMKVRQEVDKAGNLVLELADRVEMAGAPPEAKQYFQQGASAFADLQDDLEAADTHDELEAVYPKIVDSVWKLESAKALTEGQPVPAQPEPGPLFPPPPPPPPAAAGATPDPMGPVTVPQPNYRSSSVSPWLTTAATAALTMLATRSMGSGRSYRPPAPDDYFSGGGGRASSGRRGSGGSSGGGIDLSGGSGGRGVKRRR